jgi:hypothetical protein
MNIEIHLIFANNRVKSFTDVIDCIAFLTSHLCFLTDTNTIIKKEDVLLNVLSSGLTTEDETHINSQVAFNQKYQIRSNTDAKIIQ